MKSLNDSLDEYKKINHSTKSLQSYEKFQQRLKTFEMFKWFAKPIEFSPIECAKRGWINLARDTLKCVSCSNILYYYSPSALNANRLTKQKPTDKKHLIEEHNYNCPWKTLSVSENFIQIDIYDEDLIYKTFLNLAKSYKNCSQLPLLDETIYKIFTKLDSDQIEIENKSNRGTFKPIKDKTVLVLSCCGWSYVETKDILKCEKCLRSIGLWLYKKNLSIIEDDSNDQEIVNDMDNDDDDDVEMIEKSNTNQQHQQFLSKIFANTQPYSDEIIIKSLLSKLINLIEIEQENLLKSSSSVSTTKVGSLLSKKRKLDDSLPLSESTTERGQEAELFSSMGSKEVKKKLFNPISEHFNWCPWLAETERKLSIIDRDTNKAKQMNKTVCHIYAEVVNKRLAKFRKETITTPTKANLNSSQLLDKVKSAQSLLINCTSQYSLK